jgi:RimJ/RimL family protein N-acetyltransferase
MVRPLIPGKRVTLRGFELTDAPEIVRQMNDMEVRCYLLGIAPFSREEEIQWIRRTWEERRAGVGYIFGIELNAGKQLIGVCSLEKVNAIHHGAELGIAIFSKQHWGQGLGTEALHLLVGYGFSLLNLHRISLTCFEDNMRAQRAYAKVGFEKVGCLRNAIFRNGEYHDLYVMDLLAQDYLPQSNPSVKARTTLCVGRR